MPRRSACGNCGTCQKCARAEYMREWYRRPGNAEAQRQSQLASRPRRIDKVREYDRSRHPRARSEVLDRAGHIVERAVKRGDLVRQPCEVCGLKGEAHHADYSKPLDVRWLCRTHHMALHRIVP